MQTVILNVDDNAALRYARGKALAQAGFRVLDASSGEEALLMVATLRPQLVVLDVNLPGIDGLEVCKRLKTDPHTADVMVLQVSSARSTKADVVAGLEGGADSYLIEPIEPLELVATVRALLRLADREAENLRLIRQLSRTERQFIEATEAAECGLWDWDIPSGRLEWFGAHERLAGMQPGSFSGKIEGFTQILHPDDRGRVWRTLQDVLARQDTHYEDEYRFVHPDGSVRWMSGAGRVFYDEQGHAVRMTGVVRDITERKRAEDRQRVQNERLELLARAAEQLLAADEPGAMMRSVFETVQRHLRLDGFFNYRIDGLSGDLALESCAGVPDDGRGTFERVRMGQGLCGTSAVRRRPVIAEALQASGDKEVESLKALGFHAYACHPLVVGDRLLGTLSFASKSRDRFSQDEIEFMQTVCRYVAAAQERLRLLREAANHAERMEESEERFRTMADGLPLIVWVHDVDGRQQFVNRTFCEFFGVTGEDMCGGRWQALMHPDDAEAYRNEFMACVRARRAFHADVRVRDAQGRWRWIESWGRPRFSDSGDFLGFVGASADITERKQVEAQSALYRAIYQNSTDGIAIIDRDARYIEQNPAHRIMLGYADEDLRGHTPAIHAGEETFARIAKELIDTGRCRMDIRSRRNDGAWIDIALSAFTIDDERGDAICYVGIKRDITEQKQTEQRLKQERERLALALTTGRMGVYDLDMVQDRLWWSPEIYRVFGVSPERFTPTREAFSALVHPDDRDFLWMRLEDAIAERRIFVHEFRIVRPDGTIRWIGNRAQTEYGADGRPYRHFGVAIDITERKEAELTLQDSEGKYRYMFQSSGVALFEEDWSAVRRLLDDLRARGVTDLRAHVETHPELVTEAVRLVRITDVNDYTLTLFKAASKDALMESLDRIFVPETTGVFRDELLALWEGRDINEQPAPLQTLERDRLSVLFTLMLPKHDPKWRRVLVAVTDVTALRRAESELRDREEQLRVITDSVPSLISYVDAEERYRFVNAVYEQIFGLPRGEILGKTAAELLGPSYVTAKPHIDRALAGEAVRFETDIAYAGRAITVLASYTPDVREHGRVAGFYVLVTDITERKRQEEELRRWKDELEVRVRERTHELLTSQERLRALGSQLALAEQRERQKLARDLHDYLAQMLAVGRMKMGMTKKQPGLTPATVAVLQDVDTIFQQALTYTRTLIAELTPPSFQEYGLIAALKWLAERMEKDGLWVEMRAGCERVPLSEEQAVLIFQCVRELLFNVLKHAGVNRATVRCDIAQGDVRVSVEDRGKGMHPDAMQHTEPGHLGLFAVRERMEAMGGRLEVASTPGQGTTVTVALPVNR